MNPTPEQAEAAVRWLFEQPLAQVILISGAFSMVLLLLIIMRLIGMVTRRGNQDTTVQTGVLKITSDLINITGKLTDRVEALADKTGMTAEQIAAMSLIIASVNDSFGRFRGGMSKWVKADYTTKRILQREMQEIRVQANLMNQTIHRMDAVIRPDKQPIPLGKDMHR